MFEMMCLSVQPARGCAFECNSAHQGVGVFDGGCGLMGALGTASTLHHVLV